MSKHYVFSSFYLRSKFLDQLFGVLSIDYRVLIDSVQATHQTPEPVFSDGGTPPTGGMRTAVWTYKKKLRNYFFSRIKIYKSYCTNTIVLNVLKCRENIYNVHKVYQFSIKDADSPSPSNSVKSEK